MTSGEAPAAIAARSGIIRIRTELRHHAVMGPVEIDQRQKAIVEQEPAPVQAHCGDRMGAAGRAIPHNHKPQVIARDAGLLQRQQFQDGVILAVAFAGPDRVERILTSDRRPRSGARRSPDGSRD